MRVDFWDGLQVIDKRRPKVPTTGGVPSLLHVLIFIVLILSDFLCFSAESLPFVHRLPSIILPNASARGNARPCFSLPSFRP